MKIALVRQNNNSLKCAYESDYEYITKLTVGEINFFEHKKERNLGFHRKFFVLCKLLFENQELYTNFERLRKDLIIEAGYYDEWFDLHGVQQREAKSISFASMDETEFQELYNKVIDIIVDHFNFGREDLIEEIDRYFT